VDGGLVEGATLLAAPANNVGRNVRSPGAKQPGVPFYNPGMALNRDLSVLLVEAHAHRKGREVDVCDALAGTGARSLRLAHEVSARVVVHVNDGDGRGVAALRQGARANAVPDGRLLVTEGDALLLLASRRFDLVDIDPFGSPMPFLDAAVRATRHGGLVCLTATDTGALAGAYPKACRRRYGAHHGLHRPAWRSEVGLRILAGAVVSAAGRLDRAATPVLAVQHGHWMRVVARVEDSKRGGDAAVRGLGEAWLDEDGLGQLGPRAPPDRPWAGPLWTGALHDGATLEAMRGAMAGKTLARRDDVADLLDLLAAEADAAPFWVVPDAFQTRLGAPPRRDVLIARLRAAGLRASRTHLDPQGVRTDAGLAELRAAWAALAQADPSRPIVGAGQTKT
jgi:tRNA (guanine26-N2/guanine27-N2)-dimethyltransferase